MDAGRALTREKDGARCEKLGGRSKPKKRRSKRLKKEVGKEAK